jgi:hypothetical protein
MTGLQRNTLLVACMATAMFVLDVSVVNTAIPHIGSDLKVGVGSLKITAADRRRPRTSARHRLRCGRCTHMTHSNSSTH